MTAKDLEIAPTGETGNVESRLWPVTPGDVWEYNVSIEVAAGAALPEAFKGSKLEETADGIKVHAFRETETYLGREPIGSDQRLVDVFEIRRSGKLVERKFLEIGNSMVSLWGNQEMHPQEKTPRLLANGLAVLREDFRGGEIFQSEFKTRGKEHTMTIRVNGMEKVTVPAGEFDAARVEVNIRGVSTSLQTFWFVKGVGFIKDTKEVFLNDILLYEQTRELVAAQVATYR